MKKIGLVFAFLITISFQMNAQWVQSNNIPGNINTSFNSVHFVDSLKGWITGNSGEIFHTNDGGLTWITQNSNVLVPLRRIRFFNSNHGWAVGDSGLIIHTTTGGVSWNLQHRNIGWIMQGLSITDSLNVWVLGRLGTYGANMILHSNDEGNNWDTLDLSFLTQYDKIQSIYFINKNKGWFSYVLDQGPFYGGGIYITSNGGINWVKQISARTLYGLSFIDEVNGWCAGSRSIYKTTNGGSWFEISLPNQWFTNIFFINSSYGWLTEYDPIFPPGHKIHCSTDGGYTWFYQISADSRSIKDLLVLDQGIGWVVGTDGLILHTTNGGGIFTNVEEEKNSTQPKQFLLKQNYPNPFNPSTTIQYAISSTQFVTLIVYDFLGREVATLVNEEKPAGSYKAQFTMSNVQLSSGIYFYKLQAGSFVDTKKMLLLK